MKKLAFPAVIGITITILAAGSALAGGIQAQVRLAGGGVAGATVTAEPAHVAGTTNAAGRCLLAPIAASVQRVVAYATIGGVHHAAVADGVAVPAHGNVRVTLDLAQAVEMPTYLPLDVTRYWRYDCRNARGRHVREEDVTGTRMVAGRTASEVTMRVVGGAGGWVELLGSDADGYWQFGRDEGAGWLMNAPPAFYPNHFPLGYSWKQEFDVVDAHGVVVGHETSEIRLVAFEAVTVPAGTFDCARFEGVFTRPTETQQTTIWLAPKVGVVKITEREAGDFFDKELMATGHRVPMLRPVRPGVIPLDPHRLP